MKIKEELSQQATSSVIPAAVRIVRGGVTVQIIQTIKETTT
jgi:hypothetical protein